MAEAHRVAGTKRGRVSGCRPVGGRRRSGLLHRTSGSTGRRQWRAERSSTRCRRHGWRARRQRAAHVVCLVAGDRHHHLATEIRPALAAGQVVLCDRYVPSSLVLQRMDGISWDVVRQLNDGTDQPGLAVILNAASEVIEARLNARGGHSRFERQPGSPHTESRLYHDTTERLIMEGWSVCVVDVTTRTAREAAIIVSERILALHAVLPPEQP